MLRLPVNTGTTKLPRLRWSHEVIEAITPNGGLARLQRLSQPHNSLVAASLSCGSLVANPASCKCLAIASTSCNSFARSWKLPRLHRGYRKVAKVVETLLRPQQPPQVVKAVATYIFLVFLFLYISFLFNF